MHGLQFSLRFKADAMVEKMQSVMILAIFVNNVKFLLCLFGLFFVWNSGYQQQVLHSKCYRSVTRAICSNSDGETLSTEMLLLCW